LQARIEELAEKSTEGQLTKAEKSEYRVTFGLTDSLPFCSDKRAA
jgi:hypothetical protein